MRGPPDRLHFPPVAQNRRMLNVRRCPLTLLACSISLLWGGSAFAMQQPSDEAWFETHIRPVLADRCFECHGPKKQWAGLRLDQRSFWIQGGESGAAIDLADPKSSQVMDRITSHDDSFRMPPADAGPPLSSEQIENLQRWIESGAPWPDNPLERADASPDPKTHWAFQPLSDPIPPEGRDDPVATWISERWPAERQVDLSDASPRDRLRRLHFALTGLPPTFQQVQDFERDPSQEAWESAVEALLSSPSYGERMARLWMDVARYSDTKGYVYAREERTFVHAWAYRDWLIDAFSKDLPYDQFVQLQIAGDSILPKDSPDLAALGFMTLGRRFLAVSSDIIDDRLDTMFRGIMGLSISCARCHDHKFDPISTRDYYALSGVFLSSLETRAQIRVESDAASEEFWTGLKERRAKLEELMSKHRAEANRRIIDRFAEYLIAQKEFEKYPDGAFTQITTKEDIIPAIVRRWEWVLGELQDQRNPVMQPWIELSNLSTESFAEQAALKLRSWREPSTEFRINPVVLAVLPAEPQSLSEIANAYGSLAKVLADEGDAPADQDRDQARQLLVSDHSPFLIPNESIENTEWMWDNGTCVEIWNAQSEIDRWLLRPDAPKLELPILADRAVPMRGRVFRRGDPNQKGDLLDRRFPEFFDLRESIAFEKGSGRLELAHALTRADNPLTARVWVNRVWQMHFGSGLVSSASDFGLRSERPSHPELLDWLTRGFIENGWSTRWLHKEITRSAFYRTSSSVPVSIVTACSAADPENRLLWRFPRKRLSWEEMRDAMLSVSGLLDRTIGGKSIDGLTPLSHGRYRRSVYSLIDRQYLPMTFQVFDFANPDLHTPTRGETIVPQQSLFLMNHPFPVACARSLTEEIERQPSVEAHDNASFVTRLYRQTLQREPEGREIEVALAFLEQWGDGAEGATSDGPQLPGRVALAQVLLLSNEFHYLE